MAEPDQPTMTGEEGNKNKKKLFELAMKREWAKVVGIYENEIEAHGFVITKSKDTALHVAVSDGKENEVEKMVNSMENKNYTEHPLEMKNVDGNTPLHLAAAIGSEKMCDVIAKKNPSVVEIRNNDGETPFFLAASGGKTSAFLKLHSFRTTNESDKYVNCRRKDSETILHCAIDGEYLDVAYQIIDLYGDLVTWNNKIGLSPLHYLAMKPSLFRSGCHIRRLNKIIYHCTFVEELTKESRKEPVKAPTSEAVDSNYPETYRTCYQFGRLLMDSVHGVISNVKKSDVEADGDGETAEKNRLVPDNYVTCFDFAGLVAKAMLIILGLGSGELYKMKHKKEKHTWSLQIMKLLVNKASEEYESTGGDPRPGEEKVTGVEDDTSPYYYLQSNAELTFNGIKPATKSEETKTWEAAFLPEAKERVAEMVKEIFHRFPVATNDTNEDKKRKGTKETETAFLLAVQIGVTEIVKEMFNRFLVAIDDKNEEDKKSKGMKKTETAFLLAAQNGVTEIVKEILHRFPVAINDTNEDKKNAVLLAVENRQPHVYQQLLEWGFLKDVVFQKVDKEGNGVLHLAAKMVGGNVPWMIPGAALQVQWELKWLDYIKDSMHVHYFPRHNKYGESPREIFTKTHIDLLKSGEEWLTKTSESCSVVAALVATVAFATAATVPGGNDQSKGTPVLGSQPLFDVFAIGSLFALGFSITSLVMFLSILTSRYQEKDFRTSLPWKLLLGLTSLFMSIGAMLVSFCAGHFFVLKETLKYAAFPIYALTCLPLSFFAAAQFPLYFDLMRATFMDVPLRSYTIVPDSARKKPAEDQADEHTAKEIIKLLKSKN